MSTIIEIAKVCHETNKTYCEAKDDWTQSSWECAPEWQRTSAIKGVEFHLSNLGAGIEDSHNSWLEEKRNDGWKYGEIKDAKRKEHPCFVPYEKLPTSQKVKD